MNKHTVHGAIDEVVGGAKRKVGELTGDTHTQADGVVQQIKGKGESALGKLQDAAHEVHKNLTSPPKTSEEIEREKREYQRTDLHNPA